VPVLWRDLATRIVSCVSSWRIVVDGKGSLSMRRRYRMLGSSVAKLGKERVGSALVLPTTIRREVAKTTLSILVRMLIFELLRDGYIETGLFDVCRGLFNRLIALKMQLEICVKNVVEKCIQEVTGLYIDQRNA
jgi:hypothetical protein